jgi:hypothetical protein
VSRLAGLRPQGRMGDLTRSISTEYLGISNVELFPEVWTAVFTLGDLLRMSVYILLGRDMSRSLDVDLFTRFRVLKSGIAIFEGLR